MHTKDTGDWLSAQQAVQADGTELSNLPLINKKLPPLVPLQGETSDPAPLPPSDAATK